MGTNINLASTPGLLRVGVEPSTPAAGTARLYLTEEAFEGFVYQTLSVKFASGDTATVAADGTGTPE